MKKVLLLFGGNSSEHKISCNSAKSVLENIDYKSFDVVSVGIDFDNNWFIFNDDLNYLTNGNWKDSINIKKIANIVSFVKSFDLIFPIIHGLNGEDGRLQGFLDLFGINYVGCGTLSSAIGMDKDFSKIIFNYLNIPQVPYIIIKDKAFKVKNIEKKFNYPLIVKPANGGSSIGISKANNKKELIRSIREASKYDNKIIIEKYIKARELECAVIEDKKIIVSSVGEIISANDFYDYDAKYENSKSQTIVPAALPKNITEQIKKYANKAFVGLNCKGVARIDFFYDEINNQVYLNEINTMPGFTTISMYPKLLIYDGISYKDIISILINNANKA